MRRVVMDRTTAGIIQIIRAIRNNSDNSESPMARLKDDWVDNRSGPVVSTELTERRSETYGAPLRLSTRAPTHPTQTQTRTQTQTQTRQDGISSERNGWDGNGSDASADRHEQSGMSKRKDKE